MGDPARDLGLALLAALSSAAPANGNAPRWVRLAAEAKARGFPSTRAFRAWCLAHGVPIREDSTRAPWVSPEDVDRAVEGMPVTLRPPTDRDAVDAALDAQGRAR